MKRFSFIMIALMMGVMAWADAPKGYALLGDVPAGFTDLTGTLEGSNSVNMSKQVIQTTTEYSSVGATINFNGLTGSLKSGTINQHVVAYALRFKSNQTLTLTENMSIHIVMRRTNVGSNRVQISFCRNKWEDARLGYEIAADQITDEFQDIVLSNRVTANNNTWNTSSFVGENLEFIGGTWSTESRDLFRISAAAGESFEIAKIYIVNPQPTRYYFFAPSDLPEAPLGDKYVDLREGAGTNIKLNYLTRGAETAYVHYTMNGSWFSFDQSLKAATDMSSVNDEWYLVAKVRTNVTRNDFNFRLNNAGECWMKKTYNNLPLSCNGEWEVIKLPLSTSNKELTFNSTMSGIIFQIHAGGSTASDYLDIEYVYLTSEGETPCENCFQVTL